MTVRFDPQIDLFYDGVWNNITGDVYMRDQISISRGLPDEGSTADPGRASLTLNNRSGKYSPRNPTSPLFGKIGRNTPLRIARRLGSDTFTRTVASGWGTADKGGAWSGYNSGGGSKSVDGDEGKHTISTATNFEISVLSGVTAPNVDVHTVFRLADTDITGGNVEPGNIVLRFTDVNNYYLVRVQIVPTNDAVQVGLRKRVAGVESEIVTPATVPGTGNYGGESIHVRAVAHGSSIQARVWTDGTAEPLNTWHVNVYDTSLTSGSPGVRSGVAGGNTDVPIDFYYTSFEVLDVRFAGEVASWKPDRDVSNNDRYTLVEAAGILRRLGQGTDPLKSALRRFIENQEPTTDMVAYWPLDEGPSARQGAPLFGNVTPFTLDKSFSKHDLVFGQDRPAPWLDTGVSVDQDSGMDVRINGMDPSTDRYVVDYVKTQPAGSDSSLVVQGNTDAGGAEFSVTFNGANEKVTVSFFYDTAFVSTTSSATGLAQVADGAMHHVRFEAFQDGANIGWFVYIDDAPIVWGTEVGRNLTGIAHITTRFAQTATYESGSMVWGHFAIWGSGGNVVADLGEAVDAAYGHGPHPGTTVGIELRGEPAGRRLERLCAEAGIAFAFSGDLDDTERCGPQPIASLPDLFEDTATVDAGILHETRYGIGVAYRTRNALYNQTARVTLDFDAGHISPPFEPTEDDQATRNDITVTRSDGASRRETLDTGALSTLAPPDGVGRYNDDITVNVARDGHLVDQAGWRLHIGTWDEARYPELTVDLAKNSGLLDSVLALESGDRIDVVNPPSDLPPDDIRQLVQGYTETFDLHWWDWKPNATPFGPYVVGVYGDGTEGPAEPTRYSPVDSITVGSFVAGTGTVLNVVDNTSVNSLDPWSTTADTPFDIRVAGVRLRVTAVGAVGGGGIQPLTVQQTPINGVIKTIPDSSKVELWQPAVYAL